MDINKLKELVKDFNNATTMERVDEMKLEECLKVASAMQLRLSYLDGSIYYKDPEIISKELEPLVKLNEKLKQDRRVAVDKSNYEAAAEIRANERITEFELDRKINNKIFKNDSLFNLLNETEIGYVYHENKEMADLICRTIKKYFDRDGFPLKASA